MKKENLLIAVMQPAPDHDDWTSAGSKVERLVSKLNKADVILFPEYWNSIYEQSLAEQYGKDSLDLLKEIARKKEAWVIAAALTVEAGKLYNRCYILDPLGDKVSQYDKRRPFGSEIPRGIVPGDKEVTFDIFGWKGGVKICSDLWNGKDFQEFLSFDPDILFVPVKAVVGGDNLTDYGLESWYSLAHTRSKEGCIIVAVADSGRGVLAGTYHSSGSSVIVDPSIRFTNEEKLRSTVYTIPDNQKEGFALKEVCLEKIRAYRNYRRDAGLL